MAEMTSREIVNLVGLCLGKDGDGEHGTEDVEMLMTHWASPQGGFIFSDYGGDAAIGVKDSGIKHFMYDKFSRRSQAVYGEALPRPVLPL